MVGPKFQAGHEDPNQVALQNEPLIPNSPVSGDVVYAALVRTLYSSVRCHPYCLFLPRPHSTGCCFGTWLRCCGLVPSPRSSRSTSSNRPYRQKRISRGTAAQACSRQGCPTFAILFLIVPGMIMYDVDQELTAQGQFLPCLYSQNRPV